MLKYFSVNWNCDHDLKWNAKFAHFWKFIFIQKLLTKKMWHIGAILNMINKKLQKISFENTFLWKKKILAKRLLKDNSL